MIKTLTQRLNVMTYQVLYQMPYSIVSVAAWNKALDSSMDKKIEIHVQWAIKFLDV